MSHQIILPRSLELAFITIVLCVQVHSINMHLQGSLGSYCHITFVTSEHSSLVHQSLVIVEIPLGVELILANITHEFGVAVSRLNVSFQINFPFEVLGDSGFLTVGAGINGTTMHRPLVSD